MPPSPEEYEPQLFSCNVCGWILGESYREAGKRITQLRVYRHARERADGFDYRPIPAFVKYSEIKVNDGTPLCEHCGAENQWYANQDAIYEMLKRKTKRDLEVVNG